VVFLKRLPPEVIMAENPVPYTHTANLLYSSLDQIGMGLCSGCESSPCGMPHIMPVWGSWAGIPC
jgi:hypothetical protein